MDLTVQKGVGEIGLVPTAGAVAKRIYKYDKTRYYKLPIKRQEKFKGCENLMNDKKIIENYYLSTVYVLYVELKILKALVLNGSTMITMKFIVM